jgi:hypothetical protein
MEINVSMSETVGLCNGCVLGKALWKPSTPQSYLTHVGGGLIHASVNGPMAVKSLQGAKYCVCIKDGYSKYRRVLFIKQNN